jgi:glutamine---fructose-6-phosphate transaminase (isomerizing)
MTNAPGALMAADIASQPTVLQSILDRSMESVAPFRAAAFRRAPRFVLIAARGTSDHAALYAKYLVEICLQLPAGLVSPSTLTLYDAKPDFSDVLFLAISQSGASTDLVESTCRARQCGAATVAITNTTDSPLAAAAEFVIGINAGRETSVAATKTYTAQLLTLFLFLTGLEASNVPEAVHQTLQGSSAVDHHAERYRYADRIITVGRGFSYPTAREAALKLMETSYLPALAFSGADLMHGPLAMVDSQTPVIAITSSPLALAALAPVLGKLQAAGADVLEIGPVHGLTVAVADIATELIPIVDIVPAQLLAHRLSILRGEDPDRPRGLLKVTSTR